MRLHVQVEVLHQPSVLELDDVEVVGEVRAGHARLFVSVEHLGGAVPVPELSLVHEVEPLAVEDVALGDDARLPTPGLVARVRRVGQRFALRVDGDAEEPPDPGVDAHGRFSLLGDAPFASPALLAGLARRDSVRDGADSLRVGRERDQSVGAFRRGRGRGHRRSTVRRARPLGSSDVDVGSALDGQMRPRGGGFVPRSSYPRVTVLAVTRRAPRHRAGAFGSVERLDTHPRSGIAAVTRPVQEGRCLVSSERSDIFRAPAGETNGRSVTFVVSPTLPGRDSANARVTRSRHGSHRPIHHLLRQGHRQGPGYLHRCARRRRFPLGRRPRSRIVNLARRARRLPFADATRVSASPTSQVACSLRGCSRRRLGSGSRTRATRYAPESTRVGPARRDSPRPRPIRCPRIRPEICFPTLSRNVRCSRSSRRYTTRSRTRPRNGWRSWPRSSARRTGPRLRTSSRTCS